MKRRENMRKKGLINAFLLAVFCTVGGSWAQTVPQPAALPYSHNFENATENARWILANGTQRNQWHIGTAVAYGGTGRSLYISNDGGTSHRFTDRIDNLHDTSFVYAYRRLNFAQTGMHTVKFNWKNEGLTNPIYVRALLVPDSIAFEAGRVVAGSWCNESAIPRDWIAASPILHSQTTWQTHSNATINIVNSGVYKLVFFWKNQRCFGVPSASVGNNLPAAIDNVEVYRNSPAQNVIGVAQTAIAGVAQRLTGEVLPSTATQQITWSIVDDGGTGARLTSGNLFGAWAAGVATVRASVRAVAVDALPFTQDFEITVIPPPAADLPYSQDFEGDDIDEWILVNGTQVNQWHIGTAVAHGESERSLYISDDGGATNRFTTRWVDISPESYVYAFRRLNFAAGTYTVKFNWRNSQVGSDTNSNNVRAFLVPDSIVLQPDNALGNIGGTNNVPANWIAVSPILHSQNTWQTHSNTAINISNSGAYKLVFFWKNRNHGTGVQTIINNAAIDNIEISRTVFETAAEDITGIPETAVASVVEQFAGEVLPSATNQFIIWSIADDGGTGARFTSRNLFSASSAGTAIVRATVSGSGSGGSDYTQDFEVTVSLPLAADLPYSQDFEGDDVSEWVLVNEGQTNQWHIGSAVAYGESENSLYISYNGGLTYAHTGIGNATISYVYAFRRLNIEEAGLHTVIFNWRNFENSNDNVRAFLVPDSIALEAGNAFGNAGSANNIPANWIAVSPILHSSQDIWLRHFNARVDIPSSGAYKLVFFWKNTGNLGNRQGRGAAIDNITIYRNPAVENIGNVAENVFIGIPQILSGAVSPINAIQTIVWSVVDEGEAEASITNGIFTAAEVGTATIRATIAGGNSDGSDYTQDFEITVKLPLAADLPYSQDFESADISEWVLLNGSQRNQWHIGSAVACGESARSLYISADSGLTHSYSISVAAYVFAYRRLNIEETGLHTVKFNWRNMGEINADVVRAFLVPDSIALAAGNAYGNIGSVNNVPVGWIAVSPILQLQNTWQTHSDTAVNIRNAGIYKLVFFWKNDNFGGSQQPAAIDNIEVFKTPSAPIFIRNRENFLDDGYGILLENAIVSDFARISIITPEPAMANITIFDNLGNVVWTENGVGAYCIRPAMPDERTTMNNVGDLGVCNTPLQNAVIWNITNPNGRFVANGTYIIIAKATGISGRIYRYSARIGVRR